MEKLKDPAMLLSVANTIGLVGTTAYFYKQLEAIRLDMIKMSQTITGVVRKLAEIEKGEQHKGEVLHTLNDQIKRINQQIEELPSFDSIDNLDVDMNELVATLEEHNIIIERPSQVQRPRRSGDRRPRRTDDTDDRRDDRRDTSSRRATVRSSDHSRDDRNRPEEQRQTRRSQPDSGRDTRSPSQGTDRRHVATMNSQRDFQVQDSRVEPAGYDDADADIIGEIRRQQSRN